METTTINGIPVVFAPAILVKEAGGFRSLDVCGTDFFETAAEAEGVASRHALCVSGEADPMSVPFPACTPDEACVQLEEMARDGRIPESGSLRLDNPVALTKGNLERMMIDLQSRKDRTGINLYL